jgi:hypothetical protein
MPARFPAKVLAELRATKYLYIRSGEHRYIPVWVVEVEGRALVRSWNDDPAGWYRAFLEESRGHIRLEDRELPIRAVRVRSQRLIDAADEAYAAKYTTKPNAKYVAGFRLAERKANTLELGPG